MVFQSLQVTACSGSFLRMAGLNCRLALVASYKTKAAEKNCPAAS
jgi:hypothetical protein